MIATEAGSSVLDELVAMLRDPADAAARREGLDGLIARGGQAVPVLVDLLADRDPDVVLQAILALDRVRDHRAVEGLLHVLDHPNPNVVQAAITAVGHLGSRAAVGHLLRFLDDELWLRAAALEALGDLRAPEAVPALAAQLADPVVGAIAAEGLARIGDADAFARLAQHWIGITGSGEDYLARLAHVAETCDERLAPPEGFRGALCVMLRHRDGGLRSAAARCVLALGPGTGDREALACLADAAGGPKALPEALRRRADMIPVLLGSTGVLFGWGLRLLACHPYAVPMRVVEKAMARAVSPDDLPLLAEAFLALAEPRVAGTLARAYAAAGPDGRVLLVPVVAAYRDYLAAELPRLTDLPISTRAVLEAVLAAPADSAARVAALPDDERCEALSHLHDRPDVLVLLPWTSWLAEAPERYAPLAAVHADRTALRQVLPDVRALLDGTPHPSLIRLVGVLRDGEAIPALERFVAAGDAVRGPWALAALGRIGGPQARAVLRALIDTEGTWTRNAYRALAECRDDDDLPRFRRGLEHADWNVRLVSVTALGIARRPADRGALAAMLADPVAAVADRARGVLAR